MAKPNGYGGRDYPDFGISDSFATKSIVTDMGELAARLGAPNVFDRTGVTIWYDQFQFGLNNWLLDSSGGGYDPVLAAYPFLYKPHSVRLETSDTGTGDSEIKVLLPFPYEAPMGIEFAYYPVYPNTELEIHGELYTGTTRYIFNMELNFVNGTIKITDENYDYETVYTDPLTFHIQKAYNIVKIVIDLESKAYNRIMFNKVDIPVSEVGLYSSSSSARPKLTLLLRLENTSGQAEIIYLDNIIFTLDEPIR